jgi:transposase-like protein
MPRESKIIKKVSETPEAVEAIKRRVGRPAKLEYSPELGQQIYECMIAGMDMVEACKYLELNRGQVYRWKDQYPEFESLCTRAREGMMEKRLSDLRMSIKDAKSKKEDPTWFKIELSFEQWNAERMAPRMYAQRNRTEVTGKDGAPIQMQQHTIIDSSTLDPDQRDALRAILMAAQGQTEGDED